MFTLFANSLACAHGCGCAICVLVTGIPALIRDLLTALLRLFSLLCLDIGQLCELRAMPSSVRRGDDGGGTMRYAGSSMMTISFLVCTRYRGAPGAVESPRHALASILARSGAILAAFSMPGGYETLISKQLPGERQQDSKPGGPPRSPDSAS